MKLFFKKRRLLVQALYSFRAHIKDDRNFKYENDVVQKYAMKALEDALLIKKGEVDELSIVENVIKDENGEHDFSDKDLQWIAELAPILFDVVMKEDELDAIVSKYLGETWRWERIPSVVKMILRLAAYEIIFVKKERIGTIIADYLEMAKVFNHVADAKFINAVLDKIGRLEVRRHNGD